MKTSNETISTIIDKARDSMDERRTRPLDAGWFPVTDATLWINWPMAVVA